MDGGRSTPPPPHHPSRGPSSGERRSADKEVRQKHNCSKDRKESEKPFVVPSGCCAGHYFGPDQNLLDPRKFCCVNRDEWNEGLFKFLRPRSTHSSRATSTPARALLTSFLRILPIFFCQASCFLASHVAATSIFSFPADKSVGGIT